MRLLILLSLLFMTTACSLPQAKVSEMTTYRLGVPTLAPPSGGSPRPLTLVVDLGYVAPEIQGQGIVIQQPDLRQDEVAGARWPAPLPAYVKQQLIRGFVAGGGLRMVGDAPVAGAVNYRLRIEILDFQIVEEAAENPPRVHVRIQAVLQRLDEVAPRSETAIGAEALVPAEARRMSAIVHAFDKAFAKVTDRIAQMTFSALPTDLSSR